MMDLVLDLREMRQPEARVDGTYPAARFGPADDDFAVARGVVLALLVRRDGDKCRISGRIRTALALSCSRCLERFETPEEITVDLLYLPDNENHGQWDSEIAEEDLSVAFYRDSTIDLRQLVREQFRLALPMKPLCRAACRGLCPACGGNRNTQVCGCETTWHDPRLAGLAALATAEADKRH